MGAVGLVKAVPRTGREQSISAYDAGVAYGDECRRRGAAASKFFLVAIADEYASGFRAGFFQRIRSTPGFARVA